MHLVRIIDTEIKSPTEGMTLWAGVVDDYRPIFDAYSGRWDRLLAAVWLESRKECVPCTTGSG